MEEYIDWELVKQKYSKGSLVEGVVEHHAPFGIFVDIKHQNLKGIVQITDFLDDGIMTEKKYPKIGEKISAVVIGYTEDIRNQIWLSMKPSILKKALGC